MVLAKNAVGTKEGVTADELWQLSGRDQKYELVRGELVEMAPAGGKHGNIALRLGRLLQDFVDVNRLGEAMVETGFRLTTDPDTVRGPDLSLLAAEKIPPDGLPDSFVSGAPDLAVEIVLPNDTATEVQAKVQDYLTYGTQLVWVIYPRQRLVVIYRPDGTAQTLGETDTLSGEKLLPGFTCRVGDIFG